jgi:uncharacterized membrane protein
LICVKAIPPAAVMLNHGRRDAVGALKERLAGGEINQSEFEERCRSLQAL